MARKLGILAAVLTTLALTVTLVVAGNAHFVGTPSISTSGSTATVSGKIAGLGNIDQIYVEVTAEAQCVNRGHQDPSAANKQSVSGSTTAPVQNGKANFSVTLNAAFSPPCSPPMTISWTLISIVVHEGDASGPVVLTYP
jgi:hypothetical protein